MQAADRKAISTPHSGAALDAEYLEGLPSPVRLVLPRDSDIDQEATATVVNLVQQVPSLCPLFREWLCMISRNLVDYRVWKNSRCCITPVLTTKLVLRSV
ncbi:hypothetical protein ACU4GD_35015 [Cupriavidus basilensis]